MMRLMREGGVGGTGPQSVGRERPSSQARWALRVAACGRLVSGAHPAPTGQVVEQRVGASGAVARASHHRHAGFRVLPCRTEEITLSALGASGGCWQGLA